MSDVQQQMPEETGLDIKTEWGEIEIYISDSKHIGIYFVSDDNKTLSKFMEGCLIIQIQDGELESQLELIKSVIDITLARPESEKMKGIDLQFAIRDALRNQELEVNSDDVDHYGDKKEG